MKINKYNIGDVAWTMNDNKVIKIRIASPINITIHSQSTEIRYKGEILNSNDLSTCLVVTRNEEKLFSSKEELLNSL